MWFRNIQLYRLHPSFELTEESLLEGIEKKPFAPCLAAQETSTGWVSPLGKFGDHLVHTIEGKMMVALKQEDKIVPASVVNEALAEKIEEIETRDARKVTGKEKTQLKDDLRLSMLPRAFSRTQTTYAYIDTQLGLLIINAASPRKAEALIMFLRECLGSLPVTPLSVASSPSSIMTEWLKQGSAEAGFEMGMSCELHATTEEGGVVKIQKQSLQSEEIDVHIEAGKVVTKMALEYQERLAFTLNESLELKGVKYLDAVTDQLDDIEMDDPIAEFDTAFTLMAGELKEFLPVLFDAMGGELIPV